MPRNVAQVSVRKVKAELKFDCKIASVIDVIGVLYDAELRKASHKAPAGCSVQIRPNHRSSWPQIPFWLTMLLHDPRDSILTVFLSFLVGLWVLASFFTIDLPFRCLVIY